MQAVHQSRALPRGSVDRLFSHMLKMYGNKWADYIDLAGGVDATTEVWAAGLAGLSSAELRRGLEYCLTRANPWPPTLPEFRGLCRPPRNPEAEFSRAAHIIGRPPYRWDGDAVLYATVMAVGFFEVRNCAYAGGLKARWEMALRDNENRADLPEPPGPVKDLIEEKPTPRNKAIDILADLKARFFTESQP